MNWKNLVLGIIYFILLFASFLYYISYFIPATPPNKVGNAVEIAIIPNLTKWAISLTISIVASLLIIFLVKVNKINSFLKPKKWKILPLIIIIAPILFLIYAKDLNLLQINYYLVKHLTFNAKIVFSSPFEFMELIFPLMIYYLIICAIYAIVNKKQGAI